MERKYVIGLGIGAGIVVFWLLIYMFAKSGSGPTNRENRQSFGDRVKNMFNKRENMPVK